MTETTPQPTESTRLVRIQETADEVGLTTVRCATTRSRGCSSRRLDPRATTGSTMRRTWSGCVSSRDCATTRALLWRRSPNCSRTKAARERGHAAYHATTDPAERRRLLSERVVSYERQIETLRRKIGRLQTMVDETEAGASRPSRGSPSSNRASREVHSPPDRPRAANYRWWVLAVTRSAR